MPVNFPAIWATLKVVTRPRVIVPDIAVRDIRFLNFRALYGAGYRGVVIDKDNCVTAPLQDDIIPDLKDAWHNCQNTFGRENVLIVSNSAGTSQDPGWLAAESLSHNLNTPVLKHLSPKPSPKCSRAIIDYFAQRQRPASQLIVIGDRILTDIIMAHTGALRGSLGVLTTTVWKKEGMAMRAVENWIVNVVKRYYYSGPGALDGAADPQKAFVVAGEDRSPQPSIIEGPLIRASFVRRLGRWIGKRLNYM